MADVTVHYKGSKIAELDEVGMKTLATAEKYCDGNIILDYAPTTKTYEITLAKASGWVLLTSLDEEVLEHMNDANMVVTLSRISGYAYEWYGGSLYIVTNTPWGYNGNYPVYGLSCRETATNKVTAKENFYPANNTGTSDNLGGLGSFRITDGKYYLKPYDGYVSPGTYRLTFKW